MITLPAREPIYGCQTVAGTSPPPKRVGVGLGPDPDLSKKLAGPPQLGQGLQGMAGTLPLPLLCHPIDHLTTKTKKAYRSPPKIFIFMFLNHTHPYHRNGCLISHAFVVCTANCLGFGNALSRKSWYGRRPYVWSSLHSRSVSKCINHWLIHRWKEARKNVLVGAGYITDVSPQRCL